MTSEPETQAEIWTVGKLLQWTTSFFQKKGIEQPRLEAEILLARSMGVKRVDLYVRFDEIPDEETRAKFRDLVRRRATGEPVAYLVGQKEFYTLELDVDSNALIPRPETEELVSRVVALIRKKSGLTGKVARNLSERDESAENDDGSESAPQLDELSICDVGVGSGCIALSIASSAPNARVTAIDISESALGVAEKNARKLNLTDNIVFLTSDLLESVSADLPEERRFDMIISNPPYVSEEEYQRLEPTVRDFEPKIALVGGPTGAEIALRLVAQAPDRLKSGGALFLELSPTTIRIVADAMRSDARWSVVEIQRDQYRADRFIYAERQ